MKDATELARLRQLRELGSRMRRMQRSYFTGGDRRDLGAARKLEAEFDRQLALLEELERSPRLFEEEERPARTCSDADRDLFDPSFRRLDSIDPRSDALRRLRAIVERNGVREAGNEQDPQPLEDGRKWARPSSSSAARKGALIRPFRLSPEEDVCE